jgi:hypothetical protein
MRAIAVQAPAAGVASSQRTRFVAHATAGTRLLLSGPTDEKQQPDLAMTVRRRCRAFVNGEISSR